MPLADVLENGGEEPMTSVGLKSWSQFWSMCIILALGSALLAVVACGGDGGGAEEWEFQKVEPLDQVYTLDDLLAMGFKKSKTYKVEGLPEAVEAYMGFWGLDPYDRKEYELRFYASHEAAVEHGTALAGEASGEGMKANKDTQTWQEGAKHRWFSGGTTDISSPGSMQKPGPRYGDFAIFGNLIMLCEGADSGHALERCESLVSALRGAGSE